MKVSTIKSLCFVVALTLFGPAHADEITTPTTTNPEATAALEKEPLSWNQLLQKKYNFTDEQMKVLTDSKLPESQLAMVSQLVTTSTDKTMTIDQVLKMRLEQKMGWGKIAKELGVPEGSLGAAVSSLKKERNEERKKFKKDKHAEMHTKNHENMHNDQRDMHSKKEHPERKEKSERSGKKDK